VKVRFLRGWGWYREGQVLPQFHDGMVRVLVRRGIVEILPEQQVPGPPPLEMRGDSAVIADGLHKATVAVERFTKRKGK
jgi:hypothetical protein